jgi:hypothetical protein
MEPALKTNCGEGSVINYCRRVVEALLELGVVCLSWPNAARKEEIKLALGERCGLDGVIGIVDVTHIRLMQQPVVGGPVYLSRKKCPSVRVSVA